MNKDHLCEVGFAPGIRGSAAVGDPVLLLLLHFGYVSNSLDQFDRRADFVTYPDPERTENELAIRLSTLTVIWLNPRERDRLIESPEPDIAHGDLARLTFDLEANESRLVIDGIFIVIDKDRHQLAIHDVHHHTPACDDLVVVPFIHLHIAT